MTKKKGKEEEIAQKNLGKREGFIQKILSKKEVGIEKAPSEKEERAEKVVEPKVTSEEEIIEKNFVRGEAEKPQSKKEEVAEEPRKQIGEMSGETKKKCSEVNKLLGDFTKSVGAGWKGLGRIKERIYTGDMMSSEKTERELYSKLEKSREEVRAELDELHRILGRYEERVRYKDEADGELQALEEVKVMLGNKLRNIAKRIEKLKVRSKSDMTKLFAEAKECEDEVRRSEEDILDFEREYIKFLSMMGKISG